MHLHLELRCSFPPANSCPSRIRGRCATTNSFVSWGPTKPMWSDESPAAMVNGKTAGSDILPTKILELGLRWEASKSLYRSQENCWDLETCLGATEVERCQC